jgi:enamine deaminase RidA (YjgF/YER057c/UK114 family)
VHTLSLPRFVRCVGLFVKGRRTSNPEIRLNFYTTDVEGLLAHNDVIKSRLSAVGCQPSSTLLGVKRLAYPELLIEIEATAAE